MTRSANSLPDPGRPAGAASDDMPFDHLMVVMMENHSFDNLLGALAQSGQPAADGLTFGPDGHPINSNPDHNGQPVFAFPFPSTAQGSDVIQNWNATHAQVNGGLMDGFVRSVNAAQPMGYYPPGVMPFAYSLARTFTVANRWFASVPGPTFPNRRFMLAGTAYGDITTALDTVFDDPPPNGTIFDRLEAHGITWRDYFTDVPMTALIPSVLTKHPTRHRLIDEFFDDCRSGNLPAVSFVDPDVGLVSEIGKALDAIPGMETLLTSVGARLDTIGGDEEDPQDMSYGERWAFRVIQAVLNSPAWPRTLLIYTYDEHGGYYDHVTPPDAIAPDAIPPNLTPGDVPGGYDQYGPRVPAIVVSPYSKPGAVTDVVHDHTSVLATIEHKWNLPALTLRDANAATVMDFLDPGTPALLHPPAIDAPLAGP
jgi:phospholipase C